MLLMDGMACGSSILVSRKSWKSVPGLIGTTFWSYEVKPDEFEDCTHGFALALVAANKCCPLEAASFAESLRLRSLLFLFRTGNSGVHLRSGSAAVISTVDV